MKQEYTPLKLMIAGTLAAAVFAVAGPSASAQSTCEGCLTTSTTSSSTSSPSTLSTSSTESTGTTVRTSSTAEMVLEACQRSKARTAKFLQSGIPEQFGSEEPFTFDPNKPC
jgi:hypothetical protein